MGPLISRLRAILREHRLRLQPEMVILLKMLFMVEGMGIRLDPDFSLREALTPTPHG